MPNDPPQPAPPDDDHGVTAHERETLVPDLLARRFAGDARSYWQIVWTDFKVRRAAVIAMWVILIMALMAVFAPLIANHRPYALRVPESIASGAGLDAVHAGLQFPLFAALGMIDWTLLFGMLTLITAILVRRRAARSASPPSGVSVTVLFIVCILPALVAWLTLRVRGAGNGNAEISGFYGQPTINIIMYAIVGAIGAGILLKAIFNLYTKKRDELGNLVTGGAITAAFVGALVLLVASSWFGTRGQRAQDVTDYHTLAANEDVWAVFAPVRQDFLSSESFIKKQPPLGPYLRIQPSGGSSAAADLGLTDVRSEAYLDTENSAVATDESPIAINRDTLLAELRNGRGMRGHDSPIRDFTIVSHSLKRFSVSLYATETLGDVIEAIDSATDGEVVATIGPQARRLVLIDHTKKAPTNFLGTDSTGSDVAARLIHATRVALSIGFVSTSIALLIGVTMGALMGYFGGWVDIAGMRIIEIFMAIPRLFLLLTIIAFIPPEWNDFMLYAMMAVIGATSWMGSARFIRAEFFKLRDQDFVQAAKAMGLPIRSVLFKHMLPNGVTPVLVDASFGVAAAIFVETGLSFLGFGIKPPNPSWGQMLADAVDATGVFRWWMAVFPGIMIFFTVFAFNLVGDALRDAIDPKLKKAAA